MPWRRAFYGAVVVFIGVNVALSVVALAAKLPDLPHTHATTDRITVATVVWGDGSIISPPLVFMVVLAALLWGATAKRIWLSTVCVAVIVLGTLLMAVDEFSGDGGLKRKPALYSQSKWDLVLVLGWIFIAAAAGILISGVALLATRVKNLAGRGSGASDLA